MAACTCRPVAACIGRPGRASRLPADRRTPRGRRAGSERPGPSGSAGRRWTAAANPVGRSPSRASTSSIPFHCSRQIPPSACGITRTGAHRSGSGIARRAGDRALAATRAGGPPAPAAPGRPLARPRAPRPRADARSDPARGGGRLLAAGGRRGAARKRGARSLAGAGPHPDRADRLAGRSGDPALSARRSETPGDARALPRRPRRRPDGVRPRGRSGGSGDGPRQPGR